MSEIRDAASPSSPVQSGRITAIAPAAREWLATARDARVLNVFTAACNLIDEQGRVLSLVARPGQMGPFAAWVPGVELRRHVRETTPIVVAPGVLRLGTVEIETSGGDAWSPRPEWQRLRAIDWAARLPECRAIAERQQIAPPNLDIDATAQDLARALAATRLALLDRFVLGLAGRGGGLTPAGDDALVGVMLALWATSNGDVAAALGERIAAIARPRTTSLSAAWLTAAAAGEAAAPWHGLVTALSASDDGALEPAVSAVLAMGHDSGACAFEAFLVTAQLRLHRTASRGRTRPGVRGGVSRLDSPSGATTRYIRPRFRTH